MLNEKLISGKYISCHNPWRISIDKKNIYALALCFPFIPVYAIQTIIGSRGYLVLMLLACMFIFVDAFHNKEVLKNSLHVTWALLLVWMSFCSYLNSQPMENSLYYIGKVLVFFLLNFLYLSRKDLRLLIIMRGYVGLVIIITTAMQIIAPGYFGYIIGSGNNRNFFASDNYLGYYYTAYIALCLILDYVQYGKTQFKTYVMIAVCMLSICEAWAVKNVIGIGIIIVYILFVYHKKVANFLGPKTIIALYVIIYTSVVFLNIQGLFSDFFAKYFGKTTTLSVRYYIWRQAIENFKASPLFGYGIPDGGLLTMQVTYGGGARSSHNLYIEVLLEGGVPGLAIYISSVVLCMVRNIKKLGQAYRYEFLMLLFIIFIFYTMEIFSPSIYYPFYYMPLILISNFDYLMKIKERGSFA